MRKKITPYLTIMKRRITFLPRMVATSVGTWVGQTRSWPETHLGEECRAFCIWPRTTVESKGAVEVRGHGGMHLARMETALPTIWERSHKAISRKELWQASRGQLTYRILALWTSLLTSCYIGTHLRASQYHISNSRLSNSLALISNLLNSLTLVMPLTEKRVRVKAVLALISKQWLEELFRVSSERILKTKSVIHQCPHLEGFKSTINEL